VGRRVFGRRRSARKQDSGNDRGEVFKYPAGGNPVAVLQGNFDEPLGTAAVEK
jgi:hypothetical protein